MIKVVDFLKHKVTATMYVWGVIMILDPSSKGDWPAVISAVCVLTAGILSIRREWKTKD